MKSNRWLVLAGYALGLFCMVPLLETIVAVAPLDVGSLDWRFGAVGRLSQNTLTPLIGLGVMVGIATWASQRTVLTALSVVTSLAALSALAMELMFTMDMLGVRPRVAEDLIANFDTTSRAAMMRLALTLIVAGLMGIGAWKARGDAPVRRTRSGPGVVASPR